MLDFVHSTEAVRILHALKAATFGSSPDVAALFSSKRVEFPLALVLNHPQHEGLNMIATLFAVDIPLIIFIGIVVLLGLAFIAGALFIFLVLPGKSEARRRRERRENRRRMLAELVFEAINRR